MNLAKVLVNPAGPESRPSRDDMVPEDRLKRKLTSDRLILRVVLVVFGVAVVWAWRHIEMSFGGLVSGLGDVQNLLGRMLPPKFSDLSDAIRLDSRRCGWQSLVPRSPFCCRFPLHSVPRATRRLTPP